MNKSHNLLDDPVEAVMTPKPIVVAPDIIVAEALALLNEKKRSVLLVVDGSRKPLGIVHLHDLLRLGAA
jgi:arabinose-5-phosphate isomerase